MSYPVFYASEPELKSGLSEEESFHACRVLRLKNGDQIHILDGKGKRFEAELEFVDSRKTTFRSLRMLEEIKNPAYSISIWVAPTKQMERMEWMVEKCTELGIHSIGFFHSRYSERKEIKLNRLEKIAISALKQSKNLFLNYQLLMINLIQLPFSDLTDYHQIPIDFSNLFFFDLNKYLDIYYIILLINIIIFIRYGFGYIV